MSASELRERPRAEREADPLTDTDREGLLRYMLIMRLAEERALKLYKQGKIPGSFYDGCGQEAISVGAAWALAPTDRVCILHRDLGAHFVRGLGVDRYLANYMGRSGGPTGGRDGNMHFGERSLGCVGMVSMLPDMALVATGLALAFKLRGERRVAMSFFGEGSTANGQWHEAMNMAGVRSLPVVFVLENNRFAYSTPNELEFAVDPVERAQTYGFEGISVDGNDVEAVFAAATAAVERAREGGGPTLIEWRNDAHARPRRPRRYELRARRAARAVAPARSDRPLRATAARRARLRSAAAPAAARRGRRTDRAGRRGGARLAAAGSGDRDRRRLRRGDPTPRRRPRTVEPLRERGACGMTVTTLHAPDSRPEDEAVEGADGKAAPSSGMTYLEAISDALREEMRRDRDVFCIGQDIGAFGGAFKVTDGFFEEFGAERVLDAPLAENAIIGAAVGAAIEGLRPVCEMQFADFISCGFDQLVNVAAKMHYRQGIAVPMVIRLPSGGGFSGGPFHSQNPEAWFMQAPGLKVVAPATPADAKGLLTSAIRDPNPVCFLEHKGLYRSVRGEVPRGEHTVPIGAARTVVEGSELTVIAYGSAVAPAEQAAAQHPGRVEVIDLRTLVPLDVEAITASVARTGKVLITHEATRGAGIGAEVAALIGELCFEHLDAPIRRLTAADVPIPFSPPLERAVLPQPEQLEEACRELLAY